VEPRISFLSLAVDDLERARRFYEEGLGLPRRPSRSLVLFDLGGPVLALVPRARLTDEAGVDPGPAGSAGVTLSHNVGDPAAVEKLLAAAARAGGRLVRPARDTEWGGRAGWFADPDGHLWEVVHHPDFPVE
jgi:catechol 2,3-dioxygenase-like lactoylglutathione lyase family enzyme